MKRLKLREETRDYEFVDELSDTQVINYSFGIETPSGARFFLLVQDDHTISWVNFGHFKYQRFKCYSTYSINPLHDSTSGSIRAAIKDVLKTGLKVYLFSTSKELVDWVTSNDIED